MKKTSNMKSPGKAPSSLSRVDKLKVFGIPLALFLGMALLYHHICVSEQTSHITKTVTGWKRIYHLGDKQAERIIEIELDFHGNGSPLSMRVRHPPEERRRHHQEISKLMNAKDAERFMHFMEKEVSNH